MEGTGSFYDLLKEGYRKKKAVDVAKITRENILKKLKRFLASLSKRELISEAIAQITEIQGIFEKDENLDEFGLTQDDLDIILLIRAVVLSSGNEWQEAENLLYQLTEKYDDAVLYALLGAVKNKRKIFKCSRDTLIVAQLHLKQFGTKLSKFHELDVDITHLTDAELRNAINVMIAYTKDMKEWPMNSRPMMDNIIELNLVEPCGRRTSIGKIIRNVVFPIIRDKIDSILRIREPGVTKSCPVSDKSTQTECNTTSECQTVQTENFTASKGIQSEIIKFAKKSTQTTTDKAEQKSSKELLCLRGNLKAVVKENGILTMQLTLANQNMKSLESEYKMKIYNLEQQLKALRTTVSIKERANFDLEFSTKNLLKMVYKEIHVVQKKMCEKAKIKYDTIDAVVVALRDELESLGLKRELDAAVNDAARLRRDATNLEVEIDQRYQHVNQLIVSNELDELSRVHLVDTIVNEPPNVLLDFVSKLVPMCRNNRAYRAELRPDAQPDPPGPSQAFPSRMLDVDFPPITLKRRRQRHKATEQAEFEKYITEVQKHLPNCPREQISRCVHALRSQRQVNLNDIGVQDVVDFLNSTVTSARQNVNMNQPGVSDSTPDGFWNVAEACDQSQVICPICLDDCVNDVTILECAHLYHSSCIQEWLTSSNRCPICRQVLRLADYNFCA